MQRFTDDMKDLVERTMLCFVATVNADGTPNLSPKGSLRVLEDRLYFADIASPDTVENLRARPGIEVNIIDIFSRRGYRFKGVGKVIEASDPEFAPLADWVWSTHGKKIPVNHVIRVDTSTIKPILSPAYMFSEPAPAEGVIREAYFKKYGVAPL